jgi:PKD repeat protein
MQLRDLEQELVETKKVYWKVLWKAAVCLLLLGTLSQLLSSQLAPVYAQPSSLLVFAEASSFARLDDIDPSGWFYQAGLFNPTDSDMAVTGLRWWYNASTKIVDGSRDARCFDARYFSSLPSTYVPNDRTIRWEYAAGTISLTIPPRQMVVPWIEVPPDSVNNDAISATYYVQAYVDGPWVSSPLYVSHSGHDKIVSTVFRADFDLATDPNSEDHTHPNPEWLFNEDRSVTANLSTRVRVIPITSSRNTNGMDYATVNVTLPAGWGYVSGSASNPHNETITATSVGGKDRLQWELRQDVLRYSITQSMAQNYVEFNVTAPHLPGIHTFTVTSAVTSLAELRTTIENQSIHVVVKTPPHATFTSSPTTPLTNEDVTFNASASLDLDGRIGSYLWDFADGNTATGNVTTHSFVDNGTYVVTLTIIDNDGLNDTALDTIAVLNRPPVATFIESAETADTGVFIFFNASASHDLDGAIVSYVWDFDDGTNATGVTAAHSYADDGTYVVTLTVTDDDGAAASTNATKTITNRSPIAAFTESRDTVYTGETITFNATNSYDSDGAIIEYFWDFGDNTNATGVSVAHSYADNGTYTITLTVTDDDGASAIATDIKTILNRAPLASFEIDPQQPRTNELIIFNASDSYDLDGRILTYTWNFGDDNITAGTSPTLTHTYKTSGDYSVVLSVTDNDHFSNSSTRTFTVQNVDVALLDITVSAEEVYVGQALNISVAVRNEGAVNETFNVTLYYDGTVIETQIVTDLAPGAERTLTFRWNTTGVTPDVSYTLRAVTSGVAGDTDTAECEESGRLRTF